jgi:hypothetical protein
MKSMNRIVPTARKTRKLKKERDRERRTDAFVHGIMEELKQLPPAERQAIVDLLVELCVSEKKG